MQNRRHPTPGQLQARIATLEAKVRRLERSTTFGCLNRNGLNEALRGLSLEGLVLVYWDLDDLRRYNRLLGKPAVNRKVKRIVKHARKEDLVAGQVFSGDEFCAFVPDEDAAGFAERLRIAHLAEGFSATFVILQPKPGERPQRLMVQGEKRCSVFKKRSLKGQVHDLRPVQNGA